jgi:hypothetical protein
MGHIISKTNNTSKTNKINKTNKIDNKIYKTNTSNLTDYLNTRKKTVTDWDILKNTIDINVCKKVDELVTLLNLNDPGYIIIAQQLCKILIQDVKDRNEDYFQCIFNDLENILNMDSDTLLKGSIKLSCQIYNMRINIAGPRLTVNEWENKFR